MASIKQRGKLQFRAQVRRKGYPPHVAADRRLANSMSLCRDLADQLWVTAIGYLSVIGQMVNGRSKAITGGQFVADANSL